jgi:hypothetical protein
MSRESFEPSESGLERTLPDTFSGGFPDVPEELISHELDLILAENPNLLHAYAESPDADSLN